MAGEVGVDRLEQLRPQCVALQQVAEVQDRALGTATFTVSASPVPTSPLTVSITVSQSGDFATVGSRMVTIGTSGSATLSVPTINDAKDEPNGSVTATIQSGNGYTIGTSAATVAVSDNDDPPRVIPTISIAGGSSVTEGGNVVFKLSASPQSGDFASAGSHTD